MKSFEFVLQQSSVFHFPNYFQKLETMHLYLY